jgi:very-short-patch-repair endonuclease
VCGQTAALSHRSSTELYEMLPRAGGPIHVTVPGPVRREHEGIVVHATSSLEHYEIRERHGIPVTSPIRTLVDLAATATDQELERAVAEAFALRLTTLPSLQRATAAYQGRRGVKRLRALLDAEPRLTRSPPERSLLRAIRQAGLPEPETNVRIHGWEVDFLWRAAALVVEVDGYSAHSSPWAFERDRRKDAELATHGLTVQRFTAARVRSDLDSVIAWLRQSV